MKFSHFHINIYTNYIYTNYIWNLSLYFSGNPARIIYVYCLRKKMYLQQHSEGLDTHCGTIKNFFMLREKIRIFPTRIQICTKVIKKNRKSVSELIIKLLGERINY